MAKQKTDKILCDSCESPLAAGAAFCDSCGRPTRWATHDERAKWEVAQWRTKNGGGNGSSGEAKENGGSAATPSAAQPAAPVLAAPVAERPGRRRFSSLFGRRKASAPDPLRAPAVPAAKSVEPKPAAPEVKAAGTKPAEPKPEVAKSQTIKAEPPKAEPAKIEPAKIEPAKIEPAGKPVAVAHAMPPVIHEMEADPEPDANDDEPKLERPSEWPSKPMQVPATAAPSPQPAEMRPAAKPAAPKQVEPSVAAVSKPLAAVAPEPATAAPAPAPGKTETAAPPASADPAFAARLASALDPADGAAETSVTVKVLRMLNERVRELDASVRKLERELEAERSRRAG
jgi:hypothetical protein